MFVKLKSAILCLFLIYFQLNFIDSKENSSIPYENKRATNSDNHNDSDAHKYISKIQMNELEKHINNTIPYTASSNLKKKPRQSSLVFVFDATGSMYDDLVQLQEGAQLILRTMLQREYPPVINYVLVPYRDPEVGPVVVTSDFNTLQKELEKLEVSGGGDCPEMSITAIREALNASLPHSYIYVFTDATATDHVLVEDVLNSIQRKKSQVFFVLTGDCNDRDKRTFQVYEEIAAASSGQIFDLNKTEVMQILKFVNESLDTNKVNLESSVLPSGHDHKHKLPVDDTLKDITISVTGKDPEISIIDPKGEKLSGPPKLIQMLDLSKIKIVTVVNPEPGNWTITSGSTDKHSVKITGTSNINFDYGFSQKNTEKFSETAKRPLQGAPNKLLVKLIDGYDNVKRLNNVEILNLSGELLYEIPFTAVNNTKNDLYETDNFIPPKDFFQIAINGIDKDNNYIRRVGSSAIQNQLPDKPFVEVQDQIFVPLKQKLELKCKVESVIPVSVWWFKNNKPLQKKQDYLQSTEVEFVINNVNHSSDGIYTCTASNDIGITKSHTKVTVTDEIFIKPIKIKAYPEVIEYQKGDTIQFFCCLNGSRFAEWETPVAINEEKFRTEIFEIKSNNKDDLFFSIIVKNSSVNDEGFYKCKGFRNFADDDFVYAVVKASFTEKPIIQTNLNNKILWFETNEKVTLNCDASGIPKPKISWTLPSNIVIHKGSSSDNISVNDKNQLIINKVEINNEGLYVCSAKNNLGLAYQEYTINVQEKLTFSEETSNVTINIFDTLNLSCEISGYPIPKISWYHNGKKIQSKTKSLILNNVTLNDSGKYSCVAENIHENISKDFQISVIGKAPVITLIPISNIFRLGMQLEIICTVESQLSTFNTSLFFIKKPSSIKNQEKQDLDSVFTNENGKIKLINNIITSQETEGVYGCKSSNRVGTVEKTIHINVLPPLKIYAQPEILEYENEDIINFTCNIFGSKFGKWIRLDSSEDLSLDSNFEITSNPTHNDDGITLTMIIKNSSKEVQGKYECIGFRGYREDKESISITVTASFVEKPFIAEIADNLNLELGSKLNFTCNASGIPQPEVIWILPDNTKIDDNSLIIQNITDEHKGLYICRAENKIGTSDRRIEVSVWSTPKFLEHLTNQTVDIHGEINLPCAIYGIPSPEIVWYHNDKLLSNQNNSVLQIKNAVFEDNGKYTCNGKNVNGNISESFHLQITGLCAPVIEKIGHKIVVNHGEKLTINCRISVSEPKPKIYWLKNNVTIDDDMNDSEISNIYEILSVSNENEGNYTCIAENAIGIDTHDFNVVVFQKPKFSESFNQTIDIDAVSGNPVNLSCNVDGNPKPLVTWTKDGFPVLFTNSTYVNQNNTLVLLKTKESDAGIYSCIASNFLGHLEKNISLFVYVKPTIMGQSDSVLQFIEGELIYLPCHVYGVPSPKVKWTLDDKEIIPSEHKQIDSENNLRFISNLTDSGNYRCEAVNKHGNASQQYLVVIFVPPFIYPENNEIIETTRNSDVIFECNAIGFPEPVVNWKKNGEFINENSTEIIFNNYGKLTILNASRESSGSYICKAENIAGFSEKNFQLILKEPPIFLPSNVPPAIELLKGSQEFRIPCQASGTPKAYITWLKDSEIIINSFNKRIEADNTLVLRYLVENMNGIYTCRAENSEGIAEINYKIEVLAPPVIQANDREITIIANEGTTVVLKCPLKPSIVLPHIIWHKDSKIIEGNTNATTLTLNNVNREDSFQYSCFANNTAGDAIGIMKLDIHWPPSLIEDDDGDHLRLLEGDSLTLKCDVDANPSADIHWMKDGEDTGESLPLFKINYAKFHHSGEYTCIASNLIGEVERKKTVHVFGQPKIEGYEFNDVQIRVNRPLKLECPSNGFPKPKMKWNIIYSPDWTVIGNGNTLRTYNISINSSGIHSCEATNDVGSAIKQFNITVLEPPKINQIQFYNSNTSNHLNPNSLKEHSHVRVECNVNGSHPLEIMWIRNGKIYKMQNLIFDNLIMADSGKYTCMARNKVGFDEMDFIIDVLVPPKIAFEFDEINVQNDDNRIIIRVLEGQSVKLNCRSDGNPIPDMYWFKNKKYMGFYDASMMLEEFGQILYIKNVMKRDYGNYTCEAINSVGNARKSFFLDVLTAPSVIQQQDASFSLSVKAGQDIFMECPTDANPKPNTRWLKHPYFEIQNEQNHTVLKEDNTTLVIHNVSISDSGNYSCIVTNSIGMAEIVYSLEILAAPKFLPIDEKKLNINSEGIIIIKIRRSFQLFCGADGNPEPKIRWYKDGLIINSNKYNDKLHISFDGRYFNMMDTSINDSGVYSCKAENDLGIQERQFTVKVLVPAEWSIWSDWSPCSSTCGIGFQKKTRKCHYLGESEQFNQSNNEDNSFERKSENSNIKKEFDLLSNNIMDESSCIGNATQQRECQIVPCKINGGWSVWSEWTTCSVLCGYGTKKRYRKCSNPTPKYGGNQCVGSNFQQKICQGDQCQQWSDWSSWSDCSVSCGKGSKQRTRECSKPTSCIGNPKELITCEGTQCAVDGGWSIWSVWSSCSSSCGKGYKRRNRLCNNPHPQFGGKTCSGTNLQIEECTKTLKCSIDMKNETFDSSEEVEHVSFATFLVSNQLVDSSKEKDRKKNEKKLTRIFYEKDYDESEDYSSEIEIAETCHKGFTYDTQDQKCIDINECLVSNNECHSTQMCENTPGSYTCFCQQGYMAAGVGQRCLDINECSQNIHSCSHECLNTPGSFYCLCPPNYMLSRDQKTCIIAN